MGLFTRHLNLTDALVVAWLAIAVTIGILAGIEVHKLGQYGTSLNRSADALDKAASAINIIGDVPFVGGRVGGIADDLHSTADTIRESATRTQTASERLSYLLGAAIIILPTVPLLAFYVPYRVQETRQRRLLRRVISRGEDGGLVQQYLARRALIDLPVAELVAMGTDPLSEVEAGRTEVLARAERRFLGIETDGTQ